MADLVVIYILELMFNHEIFERDGNNIYLELPLTFSQAALGATIDVRTLHGMVALKIPEEPKQELNLR